MPILCRDLGLLFVLTPATGSTAIARLLHAEFGGVWLPCEADGSVHRKHATLEELLAEGLLTADERAKICVATTVRNPYDRLVSMYYKSRSVSTEDKADPNYWMNRLNVTKAKTRVEWIQRHSFNQWIRKRFIGGWLPRRLRGRSPSAYSSFVAGIDVVLRYERLQDDFDALLRRLGSEPTAIPHANVSRARPSRDYRAEYDPISRGMVRFGQASDLKRFGYHF